MQPLVSIIIPVYNRSELISETLKSIIGQSYENWECLVIDDGSTDDTCRVVRGFSNDERIKLFERPSNRSKGGNAARNYGFEKSRGDFINWFDSDDIMDKHFISSKMNAIVETNADVVISRTAFFNESPERFTGKETRTHNSEQLLDDFICLRVSWYLPDPMWRRSFLVDKSLFSEILRKGQDRDFHIRRLIEEPEIIFIKEYLTFYRQHNVTITKSYDAEVMKSLFDASLHRIDLLEEIKIATSTKFFLMKEQLRLYVYVHTYKGVFFDCLKTIKKLYDVQWKSSKWVLKFLIASIAIFITGKGSVLLSEKV